MIEKTLVLLKPDCVQRGFIGEIVSRFERVGFKIIGMKMVWVDEERAEKHYADLKERRGKRVFNNNKNFLMSAPVIAVCLEGVAAIDNARKMCGAAESKSAPPGTIRGDYSHISYNYADGKNVVVRNIIHASADKKDAERETKLWFSPEELHNYKTAHEVHVM